MGKTFIDGMLQRRGTTGDFPIVKHVGENPLHISHDHTGEHVGRHQIWVDAGVVAGGNPDHVMPVTAKGPPAPWLGTLSRGSSFGRKKR